MRQLLTRPTEFSVCDSSCYYAILASDLVVLIPIPAERARGIHKNSNYLDSAVFLFEGRGRAGCKAADV
jgi:hypothetical protein